MKYILIFLFCSPIAFSMPYNQKTSPGQEIIQELTEKEEQISEKYVAAKKNNSKKLSFAETESLKVKVADILKSGTFTGVIAHKTKLIKLDDESIHYTTREVIARAYRKKDFEGNILLINSDGSSTYKVYFKNIIKVDDIVNLNKDPLFYEAVPKKDKSFFNDEEFILESNINFEYGAVSSPFKSDLINQNNLIETMTRIEIDSYLKWNFSFDLGFIFGIENSRATLNRDSSIQETNLYIGPTIKSANFRNYEFTLDLKTSLFSELSETSSNNSSNFKLFKNTIGIGLLKKQRKWLGHYNWGINFQHSWVIANAQGTQLSVKNNNISEYSLSLVLGIGKDWKW